MFNDYRASKPLNKCDLSNFAFKNGLNFFIFLC